MTSQLDEDSSGSDQPTLRRTAVVLAGTAGLLATLDLLAWVVGPSLLHLLDPGGATMKVDTALCALALVGTIFVRRTPVVALLLGSVAVVALASLVEFAFDVDLGIDQLLVRDLVTERGVPGRMAPVTAVALIAVSAARWAVQRGARLAADLLVALPIVLAMLALLGYLFDVEEFYAVARYATVALPTALELLLLALAVAASVPRGAAWWVVRDRGAGATLVRHMLPVAVVVLPALALLPLLGVGTELFGQRFALAVMVTTTAVVLLAAAGVAARQLDKIDRERLAAQAGLRQLNERLRERRDLEWRRAEELNRDLGEERARFQRAIGKIDDLIWTMEIMPAGEIRPEFSSGDASGLFGGVARERDELTRVLPDLCHPEDRHLLDHFDDRLRAGLPAQAEFRVIGYDGEVRWAWVRGTPRRERDQLFSDGISTNVTDRHLLTERRERLLALEQEHVRKLMQLNQLREELLAVTGHELRTPLAVVRGYAELLLDDSDLTAVQRKHLEVVANRARQIGLLVDDIFDLAKFSAGLATIDVEPVALDDVVAQVVEEHRPAAEAATLTIEVDLSPVTIAADPVRLRQILDNLLSNAVKYSLPGGTISVTARGAGETATIAVSDGGIGIPDGELEHVFDRMYRATSAKDHEIKGTGLGLSVTKALVEAHEGTISVVNRPGGGTRFTVAMPVQRGATGLVPVRPRRPAQVGG